MHIFMIILHIVAVLLFFPALFLTIPFHFLLSYMQPKKKSKTTEEFNPKDHI